MFCTSILAAVVFEKATFWALIGAAGGLYLFFRGFGILQRKRLILNTPESKIRSASMGLVEISGQAVGPHTIPAPACGLDCFYYHTLAWELKQSGKNKEWVKVADESLHVPFFIDDGTGRLLVDCDGAETDLHRDFHEEFRHSFFSADDPVPEGIRDFLARHGVSSDRQLKVDEYCIKPKNFLFILGTLADNDGLELTSMPRRTQPWGKSVTFRLPSDDSNVTRTFNMSVDGSAGSALEIASSRTVVSAENIVQSTQIAETAHVSTVDPQVVADALVKAGITSPRAWAAAGIGNPALARAQAAQMQGHGSAAAVAPAAEVSQTTGTPPLAEFDPHPKTVLKRGENDKAFFISWRSQKEVVSELNWKSALYIWGGPLLFLLAAYVLLQQFGGS